MTAMPFMPLYIDAYKGDTDHLSTEEHGAYLLLLMKLWAAGGYLPNDPPRLARVAGVSPKRWPKIWAALFPLFDLSENGERLTQRRLLKERQKADQISAKRKTAGAKGGTAKALKTQDQPLAIATPEPEPGHPILQSLGKTEKEEAKASSKKPRAKKPVGTRLPETWEPPEEFIAFAMNHRDLNYPEMGLSREEAVNEGHKLRRWSNKPGNSKGAKLDWFDTWRGWIERGAPELFEKRLRAERAKRTPVSFAAERAQREESVSRIFVAATVEACERGGAQRPNANGRGSRESLRLINGSGADRGAGDRTGPGESARDSEPDQGSAGPLWAAASQRGETSQGGGVGLAARSGRLVAESLPRGGRDLEAIDGAVQADAGPVAIDHQGIGATAAGAARAVL